MHELATRRLHAYADRIELRLGNALPDSPTRTRASTASSPPTSSTCSAPPTSPASLRKPTASSSPAACSASSASPPAQPAPPGSSPVPGKPSGRSSRHSSAAADRSPSPTTSTRPPGRSATTKPSPRSASPPTSSPRTRSHDRPPGATRRHVTPTCECSCQASAALAATGDDRPTWGQVLGGRCRLLRATRGGSRNTSERFATPHRSTKNKAEARLLQPARERFSLHGKEGVAGSSPAEGFTVQAVSGSRGRVLEVTVKSAVKSVGRLQVPARNLRVSKG